MYIYQELEKGSGIRISDTIGWILNCRNRRD